MDTSKWFITFLTIVALFSDAKAIDATEDDFMGSVFGSLTPLTKTLSDAKNEYIDKYLNRLRPKQHDRQCDVDHSFPITKRAKRDVGNMKKTVIPLHLSLGPNKQKLYAIPNVAAAKESTSNVVPFFVTPKQNRDIMMALKSKSLDTDKHIFSKDTEDLQNKDSPKDTKKEVSQKNEVSQTVNHDNEKNQVPVDKNEYPNMSTYNKDTSLENVIPLDKNKILNSLHRKNVKSSKVPYFEEVFKPESKDTDPIKTGTQMKLEPTKQEVNDEHEPEDFGSKKHLDSTKTDENKSNHTMVPDKINMTFEAWPTVRSMTPETNHNPLNLNNTVKINPPSHVPIVSGTPAMDINKNGPNDSIVIENRTAEEVCIPPRVPDNIIQKPFTGYRYMDTSPYNQWYTLPPSSTLASYNFGYPRIYLYNGEVNTPNTNFHNFLNALPDQRYLHNPRDVSSILPKENQGSIERTWTNTRIILPNSPIEQTIEINIKKGDKKIHSVEILPACYQNTRPIIAYSNGYYDNQNTQPLSYS